MSPQAPQGTITADQLTNGLTAAFPLFGSRVSDMSELSSIATTAADALSAGRLSWAVLNQLLHRASEAGMSEGFFRYYFIDLPAEHPYVLVERETPDGNEDAIVSMAHLTSGFDRFTVDAMLFWGNFRQAYRDLRHLGHEDISGLFAELRINTDLLQRRGQIQRPQEIPRDHRYLISEMACKTYEAPSRLEDTEHVRLALDAFRQLRTEGGPVTPASLRHRTEDVAKGRNQANLFELMYEEATDTITSEEEVVALYSGQWQAFTGARTKALENTRIYLSMCDDLDVYVATSMRTREDFRQMSATCDEIFSSSSLASLNVRYFDPTLSAAQHHEDKGLIECLMVRTAKVLLYFAQHKESLGKVSEYAMALSQGKPVIVLCPDDARGTELYEFYRDAHPLMRLVDFEKGIVNGAIVTKNTDEATELISRVLRNQMEYDISIKPGSSRYYLLKERLTGATVRLITDDEMLSETFWNNWHLPGARAREQSEPVTRR